MCEFFEHSALSVLCVYCPESEVSDAAMSVWWRIFLGEIYVSVGSKRFIKRQHYRLVAKEGKGEGFRHHLVFGKLDVWAILFLRAWD